MLVWLCKWQKRVTRIESWCDTDHAGCVRTRKSVLGCALRLGGSTVSTNCKGQAVIALSSGEAEYYGLVSATPQMLGLQSILFDCGWKFNVHVLMDATAGIAHWKPTRARTSETHRHSGWRRSLKARSHSSKKPTKEMLADFFTKHVDAATTETIAVQRRGNWLPMVGNANSGGYSCGTGSIRRDELMESE